MGGFIVFLFNFVSDSHDDGVYLADFGFIILWDMDRLKILLDHQATGF